MTRIGFRDGTNYDIGHIQPDLFSTPATPGYRRNRDTSVDAADKVRGVCDERRALIVQHLRAHGPTTVFEFMDAHGIPREQKDGWAPRFSELASEEYGQQITDSGIRRKPRPGARTRAIAWTVNNTEVTR